MAKRPKTQEPTEEVGDLPKVITPLATAALLINGVTVKVRSGVHVGYSKELAEALDGLGVPYETA